MPELPEVETIKREIAPFVKGKIIAGLEIIDQRNIKGISPRELEKKLAGKKILGIERRAKYMVFPLSPKGFLVVHLGMTGRLLFTADKYVKVVFNFRSGKKLFFSDDRLFGKIRYFDDDPVLGLGPEPLTKAFTPAKLKAILHNRNTSIKVLLLNQKLIAGIGNIYANEALFRAGILPQRKAASLSAAEIKKLHAAINAIIAAAIKYRGTSDSWYVDAKGEKGGFQLRLKVYGRKGQPCPKQCGASVVRISHGQRGTFFCPKCQQ